MQRIRSEVQSVWLKQLRMKNVTENSTSCLNCGIISLQPCGWSQWAAVFFLHLFKVNIKQNDMLSLYSNETFVWQTDTSNVLCRTIQNWCLQFCMTFPHISCTHIFVYITLFYIFFFLLFLWHRPFSVHTSNFFLHIFWQVYFPMFTLRAALFLIFFQSQLNCPKPQRIRTHLVCFLLTAQIYQIYTV